MWCKSNAWVYIIIVYVLLVAGGNIIRNGNTGGVVGFPRQVVKTGNEVLGVQCCRRYEELEIGGESRIQLLQTVLHVVLLCSCSDHYLYYYSLPADHTRQIFSPYIRSFVCRS